MAVRIATRWQAGDGDLDIRLIPLLRARNVYFAQPAAAIRTQADADGHMTSEDAV